MGEPLNAPALGTLRGTVTRGPLSPLIHPGGGAPTAEGLITNARIDIASQPGQLATSLKTDANGRYSVSLPPGTYTITMPTPQGAMYSRDLPATVTIAPNTEQKLDIHWDTGIR